MGQNKSRIKTDIHVREVYKLKEEIGRGNYAIVRRARLIDKERSGDFAVKVVKRARLDEEEERGLRDEISLMLTISHPHIVKMYDVYISRKTVYLVMELLEGGEMFDRIVKIRHFSEAIAAFSLSQILDALIYCHAKGIAHRDLKPENLFYASQEAKSKIVIGDFGLAKLAGSNIMKTCCGTPQYVAPEVLVGKPYGLKVDCWSVGVILYILLCGYPPFYAESNPRLYQKIQRGRFSFEEKSWGGISSEAKDLITKLLTKDPKTRLSAAEAKTHPWLKEAAKNDKELGANYQNRIRRFNAVRRLRAAVTTTLAICKMAQIIKILIEEQEELMSEDDNKYSGI